MVHPEPSVPDPAGSRPPAGAPRLLLTGELGRWAARWDALVDAGPLPSPFLRSWWLATTAEGRPRFALVLRQEVLVGGLALQEDRDLGVERLRLLGSGALCPDHLDLVAAPGEEAAVAAAVAGWLLRPGSRSLDLSGLAAGHRLALDAPGSPRTRHLVRQHVVATAPWIDLTQDAASYAAGRPGRLRHTLRRHRARLERAGAAYRSHHDADRGLQVLARLHDERWGAASTLLPRFGAFAGAARLGVAAGEVVFHELAVDDRVVACEVTFEVAGRCSFYQSGRSVDTAYAGAGTVLKAAVVDRCRHRGLAEYDLLRGDEAYKRDWATGERDLVALDLAVGARGAAVRALRDGRSLAAGAARRARRALGGAP